MPLAVIYCAASVNQTKLTWIIHFLFLLLGEVSSKIWKRDQGESQPYSWNRCCFCKRNCRSVWTGMQHPRDSHAGVVDHYCSWLLKASETGGTYFHFVFLCEKTRFKGKGWCANSTVLLKCKVSVTGTWRCDCKVAALSLCDPYGGAIAKDWPWQIYLCACTHSAFLLSCSYVSHWNVLTRGNSLIPWTRKFSH